MRPKPDICTPSRTRPKRTFTSEQQMKHSRLRSLVPSAPTIRLCMRWVAATVVLCTAGEFAQSEPRCAPMVRSTPCELYAASMVQLIVDPEKFHGKRIAVVGFLNIEFEGNALYLHKEDFRSRIGDNAIGVNVMPNWLSSTQCKNQTYVRLVGIFNAKNTGHMGGRPAGSIEEIELCRQWSSD